MHDGSVQLGPAANEPPGVILGCTKLTALDLLCNIVDARPGAVVHGSLSSLVRLQRLLISPMEPIPYLVGGLSTLPCLMQLTFLCVRGLSTDNVGQLGALTHLQELRLAADSRDVAPVVFLVWRSLPPSHVSYRTHQGRLGCCR